MRGKSYFLFHRKGHGGLLLFSFISYTIFYPLTHRINETKTELIDLRGGQDGAAQFLLGRCSWSRIRWSLGLSPTGKLRGPTYCPGGDKPQPTPRDAAVKMPASGVGRPAESCDTCPATYSPGASDYPLKLGTGLNGDPPGDIQWAHTGQWANCSCRHSCQLFGWASEVSSKART